MATQRYSSVAVKFRDSGTRVYSSVIYPKIALSADDIYVYSRVGDRLDLLAYKYYSDPALWWIISVANNLKGSFFVPVGQQLRIPTNISKIVSDLEQLNKDR